ncbi:unnamed protein product [Microthlaspi erraticum]|uniref:Uncharacterized protein n=1 Tax=Microthlaspi erraticum TaxID=1685480 RepID=A0A6D2HJ98_9BRAS|nr:unnamed protein product [Microthlaspi erraticum]
MEDTISNPSMEPQLFSVDPISLLLSQNSDFNLYGFERGPRYGEYAKLRESKLRLKREYEKILKEEEERFFGGDQARKKPATRQTRFGFKGEDEIRVFSPEKKSNQTRFGFNYNPAANPIPNPRRLSSSVAQSVPDFSAMIRKENRRPANSNLLPRRVELTPPPTKSKNASVFAGSSTRGSISASAGDKKSKAMMGMARKSYANVEDLKKISMVAASAINGVAGGDRRKSIGGGRKSIGGGGRTILGHRQVY